MAIVAVVGNRDSADRASADVFQSLNDTGCTNPASAVPCWVGEAMGDVGFKDLKDISEKVSSAAAMVALKAAHLAGLLATQTYPGTRC